MGARAYRGVRTFHTPHCTTLFVCTLGTPPEQLTLTPDRLINAPPNRQDLQRGFVLAVFLPPWTMVVLVVVVIVVLVVVLVVVLIIRGSRFLILPLSLCGVHMNHTFSNIEVLQTLRLWAV